MKVRGCWVWQSASLVLISLGAGCYSANTLSSVRTGDKGDSVTAGFSDWSNVSVNMLIEKYGPPTQLENDRVVWENKGPWKKIEVWDQIGTIDPIATASNIQETISYDVPQDQRQPLVKFSPNIIVSNDGKELSSLSPSEELNFLRLNLAMEIIKGLKTPNEASLFYEKTIELAESGKSSQYTEGLLYPR